MQPLFAYNALIWKNTITILTLILFVVFLVRGLYLFAVSGKHLLKSNQGFQYQQQARDIRNSFSIRRPTKALVAAADGEQHVQGLAFPCAQDVGVVRLVHPGVRVEAWFVGGGGA